MLHIPYYSLYKFVLSKQVKGNFCFICDLGAYWELRLRNNGIVKAFDLVHIK